MIFITLSKLRKKPTKEMTDQVSKMMQEEQKKGIKMLGAYWTLGRYDSVFIFEAPSEKEAMRVAVRFGDIATSETLVAVPREQAIKLV